jgi:hypothetical protein
MKKMNLQSGEKEKRKIRRETWRECDERRDAAAERALAASCSPNEESWCSANWGNAG